MQRSQPLTNLEQPVVFLGGFLSYAALYDDLAAALAEVSGQAVHVVPTRTTDWLGAISPFGWRPLLRRLHQAVLAETRASASGKVTLVAHSAGGVLARIYLSPDSFFGEVFRGLDRVSRLITLGSPHQASGKLIYGGVMSGWTNRRYPGAAFSDDVTYVAVAGRAIQGDPLGTPQQRRVYPIYRGMTGNGRDWGDGVVSVTSALLAGAHPVVLDNVAHFPGFGTRWYGDRQVIPCWWTQATQGRLDPGAPAET